jgi:hypothetical protein
MIIEDERDKEDDFNYHQEGTRELTPEDYQDRDPILLEEFLRIHKRLRIGLHMSSFVMTLSSTCGPFIALHRSDQSHFQLLRSRYAFLVFASSFIVEILILTIYSLSGMEGAGMRLQRIWSTFPYRCYFASVNSCWSLYYKY